MAENLEQLNQGAAAVQWLEESENGEENGWQEQAEEAYGAANQLERLKKAIQAQDIPVRERLNELESALMACFERQGILLFQGETGSGKSIFSPLAMRKVLKKLSLPDRIIGLQPRRDAASGIARAVAAVSDEKLGQAVGFSTSEAKEIKPGTAIGEVTPGIFLRYLINEGLDKSNTGGVIIDELHEGTVEYHLALGLLKLMHERGEAPLTLLTSATFNKERIQQFFGIGDEDYLKIEGRAYPVEKKYLKDELDEEEKYLSDKERNNYIRKTARQVEKIIASGQGEDILVFLPGAREINDCLARIGKEEGIEVLPLHGALGPKERDKALSGKKAYGVKRRVIMATNIAETSLTVPGITHVVDSCRQRSVRYNPSSGIIEKGTEFISKDQAEQRAGRAGRLGPGKCVRILTEEEYKKLVQHPESEIRRTNLSHLVLRLKKIGIDPDSFPFIEPPDEKSLKYGERELLLLGALDEKGELTELGREMGELPFEPRIGRMVIEAKRRNCLKEGLVLAAFSREENVLLSPTQEDIKIAPGSNFEDKKINARKKVEQIQNIFDRGNSDWLKGLNIFAAAIDKGVFEISRNGYTPEGRKIRKEFEGWCREYYLKAEALTHIAYKLQDYARYAGLKLDRAGLKDILLNADDGNLGCVILAAHPDGVMVKHELRRGPAYYTRLGDSSEKEINMSPGSEGFASLPAVCLAGKIGEGGGTRRGVAIIRNYADKIHPISFKELSAVLPQLVETTESEPAYNQEADQVEALTTVRLKGYYDYFDREKRKITGQRASNAFAQALYSANVPLSWPYQEINNQQLAQLSGYYHRFRGKIKMPDLLSWYKEQLGNVASAKEAELLGGRLRLSADNFITTEQLAELDALYPEKVLIQDRSLPVKYLYHPAGSYNDEEHSAVITIPFEALTDIKDDDIPILGDKANPLKPLLWVKVGQAKLESDSIEKLKDKADEYKIEEAWNNWEKPKISVPALKDDASELPLPASLGAKPIEYARRRDGAPCLAYPGIIQEVEDDDMSGGYKISYVITYFASLKAAEKSIAEANQSRLFELEKEELVSLASETEQMLNRAYENRAALYLSKDELDDLQEKLDQAGHGLSRKADPVKAKILLENVKRFIEERNAAMQKFSVMKPELESLRAEVDALIDKKLPYGGAALYGFTEALREELKKKRDEAVNYLGQSGSSYYSPKAPDPYQAKRLLTEVRDILFAREEVKNFALQQELARVLEGRDSSYARLLTVLGGKVVKATDKNYSAEQINPKEIPIGGSGRALLIKGNRAVFIYGSRREGSYFDLADGLYLFGRNASPAIKVEPRQDGSLIALARVESSYFPEEDEYSDQDSLYSEDVTSEEFGKARLAEAFDKAGVKREKKEKKLAPEERQAQIIKDKDKIKEALKIVKEISSSDLIRQSENLEFQKMLLESVKFFGAKPKLSEDSTKEDRALATLYDKQKELARQHYEIVEELKKPNVNPLQIDGKIISLRAAIESMYKANGAKIVSAYNRGWIDEYNDLWYKSIKALYQNEDVKEFMAAGIKTREQIIAGLKDRLNSLVPGLQKGEISIIDTKNLLEEVLAE
ncbi:MAG: hypothetical protein HYV53_00040 [Parcubacteria group bacterium]|nr:hypothetical protein [Parcubacteria group bacterium]